MKSIRPLISIFLFILFCTPDRDNLMDPKSDLYTGTGKLEGTITSFYPPYQTLKDINIKIVTQNLTLSSDDNGNFLLNNIKKGIYQVKAFHPNYAPDSQTVEIKTGRTAHLNFHLDALPLTDSILIYTEHISRWFPVSDKFQAIVQCSVSDPDGVGDIDSVWVNIPDFSFNQDLSYNPAQDFYMGTIESERLPTHKLHDVVGLPLHIRVKDKVGSAIQSDPCYISRIIDDIPLAVTPSDNQVVGTQPEFIWQSPVIYFYHTFSLQIYNIVGSPTTVYEKVDISSQATQHTIDSPLTAGEYYWVIWIVDEWGNRSRSKEARFRVEV